MDNTYKALIKEIKQKSSQGLIAWAPSSYNQSYEAPLGKGAIIIMLNENADDEYTPGYEPVFARLTFINERGEAFHSIICLSIADNDYDDLKSIYESAHNSYMKIDETIQSYFNDLKSRE